MPKYSIMPKGSGLIPVDRQRVLQRISTNSIDDQGEAVQQPQAQPGPSTDYSPRRLLIREITTADTEAAKKNQAQRRKRVQAKCGEVLTEAECMERLRQDEESKKAKGAGAKGAGAKGKKGKSGVVKSSLKQKPKPGVKEKVTEPMDVTPTKSLAQPIHRPIESGNESEAEIIQPRKPRRKLIPSDDSQEKQETPASMAPGLILGAFCKLMISETPDHIRDFKNEHI